MHHRTNNVGSGTTTPAHHLHQGTAPNTNQQNNRQNVIQPSHLTNAPRNRSRTERNNNQQQQDRTTITTNSNNNSQ